MKLGQYRLSKRHSSSSPESSDSGPALPSLALLHIHGYNWTSMHGLGSNEVSRQEEGCCLISLLWLCTLARAPSHPWRTTGPWHPWMYVFLACILLDPTPSQPTLGWSPSRVLQRIYAFLLGTRDADSGRKDSWAAHLCPPRRLFPQDPEPILFPAQPPR